MLAWIPKSTVLGMYKRCTFMCKRLQIFKTSAYTLHTDIRKLTYDAYYLHCKLRMRHSQLSGGVQNPPASSRATEVTFSFKIYRPAPVTDPALLYLHKTLVFSKLCGYSNVLIAESRWSRYKSRFELDRHSWQVTEQQ